LPLPSNSKGSHYTYNREVRRLRAVGRLPDILLFFRFKFLLRMARTISSAHSDRHQHKVSNDVTHYANPLLTTALTHTPRKRIVCDSQQAGECADVRGNRTRQLISIQKQVPEYHKTTPIAQIVHTYSYKNHSCKNAHTRKQARNETAEKPLLEIGGTGHNRNTLAGPTH
jgi:hypothetical protein